MKIIFTSFVLLSSVAHADFILASNGKKVTCYADDNQVWEINASRTKIRYTIEGESLGARKIIHRVTNGQNFISYSTNEGLLTLSAEKDTFQFVDQADSFEITCK